MICKKHSALLIVSMFILILSITSGAYLSMYQGSVKHEEIFVERYQMDFLARGANQLALLKLKELPGDYYNAITFSKKGAVVSPFDATKTYAQWSGDAKNLPYKVFLDELNVDFAPGGDKMVGGQNPGTLSGFSARVEVRKVQILTTTDKFKEDGILADAYVRMTRTDGKVMDKTFSKIIRANRSVIKTF